LPAKTQKRTNPQPPQNKEKNIETATAAEAALENKIKEKKTTPPQRKERDRSGGQAEVAS